MKTYTNLVSESGEKVGHRISWSLWELLAYCATTIFKIYDTIFILGAVWYMNHSAADVLLGHATFVK